MTSFFIFGLENENIWKNLGMHLIQVTIENGCILMSDFLYSIVWNRGDIVLVTQDTIIGLYFHFNTTNLRILCILCGIVELYGTTTTLIMLCKECIILHST